MGQRRPDRIVLVGMMGSGKSTVGRLLADRAGWRYVDNDDAVRALARREPAAIAAADGEAALHDLEARALLTSLAVEEPLVVAAAAWVVLDPASAAALRGEPGVVYLRARPETLRARIGSGSGRRTDATDSAWLEQRARERDALYRDLADLTIDVDERTAAEVAEAIASAMAMPSAPAPPPGSAPDPAS